MPRQLMGTMKRIYTVEMKKNIIGQAPFFSRKPHIGNKIIRLFGVVPASVTPGAN